MTMRAQTSADRVARGSGAKPSLTVAGGAPKVPVYLVAASSVHDYVATCSDRLERSGLVTITHRWWESFGGAANWTGKDAHLTREQQRPHAQADFDALRKSRIVWVQYPEFRGVSEGALIEFGMALMNAWHLTDKRCRVIVSGPSARTIFGSLAAFADDSHEVCLREVLDTAKSMRAAAGR